MPFSATGLYVMIASPGDTSTHRERIAQAVHRWNGARGAATGVLLVPRRWEADAVPEIDAHGGQSVINGQLVDQCDILFAVFHNRLGQPTERAASGTAEEIERAAAAGKKVHVYFSQESKPADVDPDELKALRSFQTQLRDLGLYGTFTDLNHLAEQVSRDLEHDVRMLAPTPSQRSNQDMIGEVKWVDPGPAVVVLDVSEQAVSDWKLSARNRFQTIYESRNRIVPARDPASSGESGSPDWAKFNADANLYVRASVELFALETRLRLVKAVSSSGKMCVTNIDRANALVAVLLRITAPEGVEIHDNFDWFAMPDVPEIIPRTMTDRFDDRHIFSRSGAEVERNADGRWVASWQIGDVHVGDSRTVEMPTFLSVDPALAGTTVEVQWRLSSTSRWGVHTGTLPLLCGGTVSITDILTPTLPG